MQSGELVQRDTPLPGGILTRIASSHIRVGSFEYAATQRNHKLDSALLSYTVNRHFPDTQSAPNTALAFLNKVIESQADLITHWMRVGFIHGVMNTDNMSIAGETIDYGPCAFMDEYDPNTVFSYIDKHGRYAFGNQSSIAQWNIARLAESLLPLIHEDQASAVNLATETVNQFSSIYENKWLKMMRSKIGLATEEAEDLTLISDLCHWMQENAADYTNTFLHLTYDTYHTSPLHMQKTFQNWCQRWKKRLLRENNQPKERMDLMQKNNPTIIPRNHQVEQALSSAINGNLSSFHSLLQALNNPYNTSRELESYQCPPKQHQRIKNTFCGT